ncbi:chemotaxis protein CheW [Cellulosilyticum sp. I15G10I2]|uniref:chemotaxis protein CheW n=1 Tax=Cellulosilyticum sp. I15G10I2 TaxID=1892843 RepID=UPI00085C0A58|nr:chemotaxis protein CheW [Cellulosilyticum sp. I15G10I2]
MATKQIVVFKLLDQEYSIDIMRVLEIGNYEPVRKVPEVPKYIEGIINLRGTIYPILNLRERLHMPKHEALHETKIILMNLEEAKVGFMVDSVCEILTVDEDEIEKTPRMLEKYESKYINGIIKKEDRIIVIFDVDLLLAEDDEKILLEIAE